jgi:hypothetical protein
MTCAVRKLAGQQHVQAIEAMSALHGGAAQIIRDI